MPPLYLGVDVGTQSCKCIVWDGKAKRVVASGSRGYSIIETHIQGRAEQHPSTWIEAVTGSIQEALSTTQREDVVALAVGGQQHSLVVLDERQEVLRNAKLWCDVESDPQARALSEQVGWTVVPSFTASKLLWLKENEPENFERLKHVLLPHDYVNFWLTGEMAMECGDASGTAFLDIHTRRFDPSLIAAVDPVLEDALPPLIGENDKVGTLRASVADTLGLSTDVIVAPGSGDNMMSALGAGATATGDLCVSLGTSGTLFTPCDRPIFDRTGAIAPFCDATGQWLPLLCTLNCTGPPEEVRKAFGMSIEDITTAAEDVRAGCEGVNVLPYFTGERTPQWPHASGTLTGLRPGSLAKPGMLYRAALEGSTFSLAAGVSLLEDYGVPIKSARVVGGGSKNRLWRRIIADVLKVPLKFPAMTESVALGAALQAAAVHQGAPVRSFVADNPPEMEPEEVEPDLSHVSQYEDAYRRHCEAGVALFAQSRALPPSDSESEEYALPDGVFGQP